MAALPIIIVVDRGIEELCGLLTMMVMAESLHDHYCTLLGLQSPWEVNDVKLDLAQQRVEIRLRH